MREKVILSDLTIYFVCLSTKWRTIERRALSDCEYFRDTGAKAVLFCIPQSPIHKQAISEGIDVNLLFENQGESFFKKLFKFKSFLKTNPADIFHCYDFYGLKSLAMGLKNYRYTPLILTLNDRYFKFSRSIFSDFFFKRLDSVYVFSELGKEDLASLLQTSEKRIYHIGVGVDEEIVKKNITEKEIKDTWVISCFVPGDLKKEEWLSPVFLTLRNIIEELKVSMSTSKKIILSLISETTWGAIPCNRSIRGMIMDMGLQEHIRLETTSNLLKTLSSAHLYLNLHHKEIMTDLEIKALLSKTPLLTVRTSARQALLNRFHHIGESFKKNDVREMKSKILKIFRNYSRYSRGLEDNWEQLMELNSLEGYTQKQSEVYIKLKRQRERLVKMGKRRKLFGLKG